MLKAMPLFEKYGKFIIFGSLFLAAVGFFDKAVAAGVFILALLVIMTVSFSFRLGIKEKEFHLLFLIIILLHFLGVLFIYYYHFYPFGGGEGDQFYYHKTAVDLSERFRQGDFSIRGFDEIYPYYYVPHFYPVLVGILYAITIPEIIIGQILNVWITALSIMILYLIAKEISGSAKRAFLIGLVAGLYPSYFYFGSLLIRDAIIVFLSLFLLLLMLKMVKKFSWVNFFFFFLLQGFLMHFRFYIGLVTLSTFIFAYFWFFRIELKKKIALGAVILLFLAVLPVISANQGLFGIDFFKKFINQETITSLREKEYQSNPSNNSLSLPGSDVIVKTGFDNPSKFIKNSFESFLYVSLGPFPWQIKYNRQLFSLVEMIPGYFLAFLILKGVFKNLKDYKIIFPLLFFSLVSLFAISVFVSNFGTYMRIRIPALLALLALADFAFLNSVIETFKNKARIMLKK
ncbi:MAG: glycosyltransferase family 39 protein [Candidatus Staskawiczbacteria bacterium]|nr:glycosyltransferase family 39 protein [Candidatus Staskawiczbacteria bacterium]